MRKLAIVVGFGVVVILMGRFVLRGESRLADSKEPVVAVSSWNGGADQKLDLKNQKLYDVFKNSKRPSDSKPMDTEGEKDLSTRCQEDRQRLAELTLDEFKQGVKAGEIWFDMNCMELEPEANQFWAEKFYGACSKLGVKKTPEMCGAYGFFMKAHVMFEGLEDVQVSDLSDEELIYGFFSTFSSDKKFEVIAEMEKRFPDSPGVAKAGVTTAMQNGMEESAKLKLLKEKLKKAKELNPDDLEILALDMYAAVESKEEGVEEDLLEFNRKNPNSGEGFYALAMKEANEGNKNQTLHYLEQAMSREPDNRKFKETYGKVKSHDNPRHGFTARIEFRPEDF